MEAHGFHQDLMAGPKQRKTEAERKHITSKHAFLWALPSAMLIQEAVINFPWERELRK